ncbi:MAG: Calx-beta domain-containing protein [Hyphomicrobiales bacterium]
MRITHRNPNTLLAQPAMTVALLMIAAIAAFALGPVRHAYAASAGVFNFHEASSNVAEGSAAFISVDRSCSGGCAGAQTVEFSIALTSAQPADFEQSISNGARFFLTFGENETSRTINLGQSGSGIGTVDDLLQEGPESIGLTLESVTGGGTLGSNKTHTLTITDNDGPAVFSFSQSDYIATEGDGSALITVLRSGAMGQDVSIDYETVDLPGEADAGSDYSARSGTLEFDANETSRTFTVPIINDSLDESTEEIGLSLFDPSNDVTPVDTATITLLDNDGAGIFSFSQATYTVAEAGGSVTLTVQRQGTTGTATVQYATANGNAFSPSDYEGKSGTLTFGPGVSTQTIIIDIVPDTITEVDETFTVTLSNPSADATLGTPSTATVTIDDDELGPPTVTGLLPNAGPPAGGNVVIISGTNFVIPCSVTFDGIPAQRQSFNSSTQMTYYAPTHGIGVGDVIVACPDGTSPNTSADNYTWTAGPVLTGISPSSGEADGSPATIATVTGQNLVNVIAVNFGSVPATNWTESPGGTSLTVVVPPQAAGTVYVTVTTTAGTSPVTANAQFTYIGAVAGPVITGISPSSTPVNTTPTVVISGTGFLGTQSVTFGGVLATIVGTPTDTSITVTAPSRASAGTVRVVVTTGAGSSPDNAADSFTYTDTSTAETVTMKLFYRWSLLPYTGKTMDALAALKGLESPDNPATNDVSDEVTAIYRWNPTGAGCPAGQDQCWDAFFPEGVGVPGANDFTTMVNGEIYWIAIEGPGDIDWTVIKGP